MFQSLFMFVLGAVSAPFLSQFVRPVAREAIKGSIKLKAEAERLAAEVMEELEDVKAEAAASVENKKTS